MHMALVPLTFLRKGRQKDKWDMGQVWTGFDDIGELEAVVAGHRDIGENEVWPFPFNHLQPFNAVSRCIDLVMPRI